MTEPNAEVKAFLQKVITCPEPGYFYLAVSNGSGWLEYWHRWPDDLDKIAERALREAPHANVYFSTYLFRATQAVKENLLPTRTIQADLDEASLNTLPRDPTVLVETSPGRHQGFWILDKQLTLEQHEDLSRRLTYSIPLCDRSGWPLGRKVRIPGTLNHKYLDGTKDVKILRTINKQYSPEEFEVLPEVPKFIVEQFDETWVESPQASSELAQELLERIREKVPSKVFITYDIRQADRSEALWALLQYGFKAGLTREEVFTLARDSANNKFADLKYRSEQALAKDVLRAELSIRSPNDADPKQAVYDIYKGTLGVYDRKRAIFSVVLNCMKNEGTFLHAMNGYGWYIRRDIGRPIPMTSHSLSLRILLDVRFGLNYTEPESAYVSHALVSYVQSLPQTALQAALSHYDPNENHVLLHTGRKLVLRITANGVEKVSNGAYNVVFPWLTSFDEFTPITPESDSFDWGEEVFGNGRRGFGTSVDNVTNLTRTESMALLKIWFLFILFRSAASARPIIATFGAPGSGKSSLFKKAYVILYGRGKSLSGITTMDDFDHAVSADPLVVFDNVDTWERWLPDRIALCAGTSDLIKRRLYTDNDTVVLKRQAIVGVTAHNPKFGREDVADRFLLFTFRRFEKFVDEETIYVDLAKQRNTVWGAIVRDIQKILKEPVPETGESPQFRIKDFSRIGLWIARGLGISRIFADSVKDVKSSQQNFSLEEEAMLVEAVVRFAETQSKRKEGPEFYSTAHLWPMLEACVEDGPAFARAYRNAVALGKKLLSMQDSLTKVIDIQQDSTPLGVRTWRMSAKAQQNGAVTLQ